MPVAVMFSLCVLVSVYSKNVNFVQYNDLTLSSFVPYRCSKIRHVIIVPKRIMIPRGTYLKAVNPQHFRGQARFARHRWAQFHRRVQSFRDSVGQLELAVVIQVEAILLPTWLHGSQPTDLPLPYRRDPPTSIERAVSNRSKGLTICYHRIIVRK